MNGESLYAIAAMVGAAWPAGLTLAVALAWDARRSHASRRRLNERLHELRRPLQALVLARGAAQRPSAEAPDPLDLALAALRDLDHEVNGGPPGASARTLDARALAVAAVDRWRPVARRRGRALRIRWRGERAHLRGDPSRIAQALDNLIANSLDHGSGPITLDGGVRSGQVELTVRDLGPSRGLERARRRRDPRHGHGLRVARAAARAGGGTVRVRIRRTGTTAVLALPLDARVGGVAVGDPHRR